MAISVAENLVDVRKRLNRAARKAGRDLSEITLVAATKGVEVRRIKEAIKEGLRVFGENYIQEAQEKINKIGNKKKKWHFIGHLQKNKARFAVDLFECIHSVDTPGLAREINKRTTHPIDILIQVNITGEKSKHGTTPEGAVEIARMMPGLKKLRLRGLMAIPPAVELPERSRPYFVTIRRLAERINRERIPGVSVRDLSMGMSNDFDIAIEEGATMVRVGTAIFGERKSADKPDKPVKAAAKKSTSAKKEAPKSAAKKKTASTKKSTKKTSPTSTTKAVSSTKSAGVKKKTAAAKGKTAAKTTAKAAAKKRASAPKSAAKTVKKSAAAVKTKAVKKASKPGAVKKAAAKKKTAGTKTTKKAPLAAKSKANTAALKKAKTGKKTTTAKTTAKKTTAVKKTAAKAAPKTKAAAKTAKTKSAATKKTAKTTAPKKTTAKKTTKKPAVSKKTK